MENTNSRSRIRCFYSKYDLLVGDINYARLCISMVNELEIWKPGKQIGFGRSNRALYGITWWNRRYVDKGFTTNLYNFQYLLVAQRPQSG